MKCSNCFNGCADIISDQCVKYTGVPIPGLGIETGDTLLHVENQIINKILTLMTGDGIIPVIDTLDLCPLVSSFLPGAGDITLNDVISALFQSICNLDGRITTVEGTIATLNANYVIACLSGVSPNSGTHEILQATITKLCSVSSDLSALTTEVHANYVLISDIDSYIEAYITSTPTDTHFSRFMIPYTAVPYFGVVTGFFDITGAGLGDWEKIYLCNGENNTPDLRGKVLVGANIMGQGPYNYDASNPAFGNPNYDQGQAFGENNSRLTSMDQVPSHNHPNTLTINDPGHVHYGHVLTGSCDWESGGGCSGDNATSVSGYTFPMPTGLRGNGNDAITPNVIVSIAPVGKTPSDPFSIIQPVYGTRFIIYIP